MRNRVARQEANTLADRLLGLSGRAAEPAATVLQEFAGVSLTAAFAVQLLQRLRDQDPAVTPTLLWLDERLAAQGTTADDIVRLEHQRQAAMNVTVRNVITSMRLMSVFDWTEFFESVSLVDEVLRADTGFAALDFATRDHYRHAIEELARGSEHSEVAVSRQAVQWAKRAQGKAQEAGNVLNCREGDVGYYLLAEGRPDFKRELGFRASLTGWLQRVYLTEATPGYLGTLALVTGLVLALPLLLSIASGIGIAGLTLLGLLALVPASDLAIALVNRAVTALVGPRVLPKLELRDGVPSSLRTIVVVPTLLTSQADIEEQIERLEVHYLANADGALYFALLSDWTDAPQESMPGDDVLLAIAVEGIARLNRSHGSAADGGARFFLFHRRRRWNESEQKWMGWERKRGKLHELNRLLRGATDTTFLPISGRASVAPAGIRYVITLDADTRLPRGTAARLVGTLAHPLNRPRFDPGAGRVVKGYAILQPRVMPSLPHDREATLFQRIFSGPGGIDPYASAVSDVYQDLCDEGSYTGKGIYDVDAFEAALAGRVPENALLSHDLFEGIFARAGLVTDIELFDEFPSHYQVAAARQHRWARGDWQLLPWLLGHARDVSGGRARTSIPSIGRWKMIDNLRRTLLAPAAFLLLLAGWTLPFALAVVWTRFVLATIALPAFLSFLIGLIPQRPGISKRSYLRAVGADLFLAASQMVLAVTLLAHQAWSMTDAIVRTLFRLYRTRRRLLEWVTAAQAKSGFGLALGGFYRRMGRAGVLAAAAGICLTFRQPDLWLLTAPFIVLWALSPLVARWVSLPPRVTATASPAADDTRTLRLIARRTWRFFETFVSPEDNALPPDNFQEEPQPVVAHRTSPTNMGLYLLSTIAARDFGWLGTLAAIERLEATLATMTRLARFRGHFYNWYDTRDLRPLDPPYVSSVDSGNLAGHLIALGHACREIKDQPLLGPQVLSGIEDTVRLIRAAVPGLADERRTQTVTRRHLDEALDALEAALGTVPATPADWVVRLAELEAHAHTVVDIARTLIEEQGGDAGTEVLAWAEAAQASIQSHARDLDLTMPWARPLSQNAFPRHATRSPEQTSEQSVSERLVASLPTLADLPTHCDSIIQELVTLRLHLASETATDRNALARIDALIESVEHSAAASAALIRRLTALTELAEQMFQEMEFGFLFDPTRKLFSIGYRVTDGSLDPSCYDLLASEARLASFVAIAKGDVPASHWFRLGRALTPVGQGSALVSWSGSMFEYLMPALVMYAPPESLLDYTYQRIVNRQIHYGAKRGVPWGVSESAYHIRDFEFTYQYSNFGVPGLGLKRGLSEDVVVAPYATALAAMVDPGAAVQNFARLAAAGASGTYGFYEALDYTSGRLPEGKQVAVVRAYMAHHQGMTLVALANVLHGGVMRARFHAEPLVQATELLLQERTPRDVAVARPRAEEVTIAAEVRDFVPPVLRRFTSAHDPTPRTHLLSNGRYVVMITAAGSGYSRWRDLAVTRWREDVTRDAWGTYIFLRDAQSGRVWSAGYQPSGVEPESYEVTFSEDRATIVRHDQAITTTLEVVVSPEDDAEVRRVSIANVGARTRE
ncbi:MAG: glucoamylase family protein, partial [Thermomicrobiales bacterium]